MKITKKPTGAAVVCKYMEPGEMGLMEDKTEIVLRTYDGLVSLSDPMRTWNMPPWEHGAPEDPEKGGYPAFVIKVLPKGTVIELEVE